MNDDAPVRPIEPYQLGLKDKAGLDPPLEAAANAAQKFFPLPNSTPFPAPSCEEKSVLAESRGRAASWK